MRRGKRKRKKKSQNEKGEENTFHFPFFFFTRKGKVSGMAGGLLRVEERKKRKKPAAGKDLNDATTLDERDVLQDKNMDHSSIHTHTVVACENDRTSATGTEKGEPMDLQEVLSRTVFLSLFLTEIFPSKTKEYFVKGLCKL